MAFDRIGFVTPGEYGAKLVTTKATSNPAAGVEHGFIMPTNKMWLLLGATVTLVQGITQTPWPSLTFTNAAGQLFLQTLCGTAALNASVTAQCSWFPGATLAGGAADTVRQGGIPSEFYLTPGTTIATSTVGIGANTDYGVMKLYVVEYN